MTNTCRSLRWTACVPLAAAALAAGANGQAQAQSDVLLYAPNLAGNTSVYTANPATGALTPEVGSPVATGNASIYAAVRGDQAFAYVTAAGAQQVVVIDTATQSVVQTVPTTGTARGVAVSADGTRLYVANSNAGNVLVYSIGATTGQLTQTATINGLNIPEGVAVSPDGSRLYVANAGANSISVINTATNAVIATVPAGNTPANVAVSPDGTRVYATNLGSNSVSVINTTNNSVVATVPVGSGPEGVVVSPDGRFFFVASSTVNTVSVFDAITNTPIASFPAGVGTKGLAVSPDGRFLYASNQTDTTLSAFSINPLTGALVPVSGSPFTAGNGPAFLAMCGNGNGMLGSGGTFVANSAAALGCTGGTAAFTGGTLLINGANLAINTPMSLAAAGGIIDTNGNSATLSGGISGAGSLTKSGVGTLTLAAASTYTGATLVNMGTLQAGIVNAFAPASAFTVASGATLALNGFNQTIGSLAGAGNVTLGSAILTTGNDNTSTTFSGVLSGTGGLAKIGSGTLSLTGANAYSGGTTISGGLINFTAASNFGTGAITLNGGGLQWAAGSTADISAKLAPLGAAGATFDTNDNIVTLASTISGTGGLTKQGGGTLILSGINTYSGGTTVNVDMLSVSSDANLGAASGGLTLNAGALQTTASFTSARTITLSGPGGGFVPSAGTTLTLTGNIGGTGALAMAGAGTLNLTGTNSYTGGTMVGSGTLAVNGSIVGNVAVGAAGTLGGNGTIGGNVVNMGTLAPGNSIGLLTVNGSYTQMAGSTYQVEANAQGQADRINVGGAAAIQGGTVQVIAAPGNYGSSTTYTIVRANGGVSGVYSGVTSNFTFLTPALSYDANDVFLTLSIAQNAFSLAAITPNQKAVGVALNQSFANASGDFATVIGALAGLNTAQGPAALDTISGQPYADFGTMNTNNAALFMNALGQQMANARGSSASTGQRQAMAQACEIESCDAVGPLSAWASALGGLGSVLGDGNASTLTYNFGGAAAGMDYRFDPRFLAGIGTGYTHGTQWVNSFMGQGWTSALPPTARSHNRASTSMRWRATPITATSCSARS
jgi:YVTN family beta-propeller protein/autotransporter-associated beta strand protein